MPKEALADVEPQIQEMWILSWLCPHGGLAIQYMYFLDLEKSYDLWCM